MKKMIYSIWFRDKCQTSFFSQMENFNDEPGPSNQHQSTLTYMKSPGHPELEGWYPVGLLGSGHQSLMAKVVPSPHFHGPTGPLSELPEVQNPCV